MSSVPLNIFQKLMRRWDAVHPYNAAQVMKIAGKADAVAWQSAWESTLKDTGLGAVVVHKNRYSFEPSQNPSTPVLRYAEEPGDLRGNDPALRRTSEPALPETSALYGVRYVDSKLDDHLSSEMNRPFKDPREPPFRPFVIQKDGFFYAGLVYQHWLADSASIRMLMREWFVRVFDFPAANRRPLPICDRGYWDTIGPGRSGWGLTESILEMTRRHVRLRRVQKIASTHLSNHDTRFRLIETPPGLIAQLRAAARLREVKVNDIFLAALIEACAAHVPLQPRRNRRDVAVGSVVDLRPYAPASVANTFGLFLGFTNVICQPKEVQHFDQILQSVARQTRLQKSTGVAPASFIWMAAAMIIGKLSKPDELYHFYRKELPLAGGLSNVDLTRSWMAAYHPAPLLDYIRISPTGPMTPLVMTTTTLGDQFHIGMTYRTGLITSEIANAVTTTVLNRLEALR